MVVSGVKITQDGTTPTTNGLAVWQQMIEQDAFDNYSKLLRDVTLSPVMGHYLDMVNNDKPSGKNNPNENYAREVMQLFSLGVYQLNPDGTQKTDSGGQPINTYDQETIEGFAHLFTGWTYPLKQAPRSKDTIRSTTAGRWWWWKRTTTPARKSSWMA